MNAEHFLANNRSQREEAEDFIEPVPQFVEILKEHPAYRSSESILTIDSSEFMVASQ